MRIKIDLPFCERLDSISKASSVQFEDLTPFDNKIIDKFRTDSDLNKFRLNLYNLYKTKVKIDVVNVSEDVNWLIQHKQWFRLSSDVFHLTDNDIWRCLPFYIVKDMFRWSNLQHRYISRERVLFFDYI